MANDCIKIKEEGDHITCMADGGLAVTGKRFVYISGPRHSGGIGISGNVVSGQGQGLVADATADKSAVYMAKQVDATWVAKRALGVASFDAPAGGLFTAIREGIVPVTAGAAITGGNELQTDNQGRVIPLAAGVAVGLAMDSQATVGNDVEVLLYNS